MEFIDLKAQYRALQSEIDAGIRTVLNAGRYIGGEQVDALERELAAFTGRKHCITCGNGTDALQLAFMMLGIGKGDAVFCPDITFISSTEPAGMLGAVPVFCDTRPDTYNLCPASLERQICAVLAEGKLRPRVVVAVDILGNPCGYDEIVPVCEKYGLTIIEDAAQSCGAEYHGRKCGSFGQISITSFFPAKPLGCYGDGGAVFVDDDRLAALCRSLCVHGKGPHGKYDNVRIGVNSRLDAIQAAVLLPKLHALSAYEMDARQRVAARYNSALGEAVTTPFVEENCRSAYAQYAILMQNTEIRDRVAAHLKKREIPCMIYYPTPQHALPVFTGLNTYGETYPNALDYCARTLSLPMHPYLDEEQQNEIIAAVLEAL